VPCSWLESFEIDTPQDLEFARRHSPHIGQLLAMEET
jgi:hypothetical protein